MNFIPILLLIISASCATEDTEKPDFDVTKATAVQNEAIIQLTENHTDGQGFLTELKNGGDSFLWQAKWCAITGCNMNEFESPNSGRYCRDVDCDVHTSDDDGNGRMDSNTSWSGDMGICGLIPWAMLQDKQGEMERHVQYGADNNWTMGEIATGLPFDKELDAKTRVNYSPILQRVMRSVEAYLLNRKSAIKYHPFLDTSKKDFAAHLQTCHIWTEAYMRGEATKITGKIVGIHHNRVPGSPFYAFMHGWLNGEWNAIQDICESTDIYLGDYVRCDGSDQCGHAEKIFSCELLIRSAGGQMAMRLVD